MTENYFIINKVAKKNSLAEALLNVQFFNSCKINKKHKNKNPQPIKKTE